jgi:hypothetical protein
MTQIVYVAFVADIYSRAVVGWSAATHKRAKLVLDALQMALWRRDRSGHPAGPGLVHHSDAGSQGGFNRSGVTTVEASEAVGVSWPVGARWFRHAGGMPPLSLAEPAGRYLSFAECLFLNPGEAAPGGGL